MLYDRLDGLREQAAHRLTAELRNTGGTLQDRSQRDSSVAMYADQVEQFSAVENGLCFGRLDGDDDSRRYIGRIGIFDTSGDYDPLLMDWRAPAARPFYLATAANPQGVRRRRHLRTRQRKVTGLNDEVLDIDTAAPGGHEELTGEASLLAALNAGRTGRMRDIVETIQAEQDQIIRAELPGVMVVQGGPGTGKTAVALHRAAYLLYTHRRELSSRGVLLVGPNATFLRYISQVLPTLAETGVLLRTQADLFPGVSAQRTEPAETAALKGRAVLAEVLALAVRDRQWVPDEPLEIEVERETLTLDPEIVRAARDRVRRVDRPHNLARALFDVEIVARHRRPGGRADRRRPAGRGQPARRGGPGRDPPRAARGDGDPGRPGPAVAGAHPAAAARRPVRRPGAHRRRRADAHRGRAGAAAARAAVAGRRPTCRCSTRPPSCSARTSGPPPPGGTASG